MHSVMLMKFNILRVFRGFDGFVTGTLILAQDYMECKEK